MLLKAALSTSTRFHDPFSLLARGLSLPFSRKEILHEDEHAWARLLEETPLTFSL